MTESLNLSFPEIETPKFLYFSMFSGEIYSVTAEEIPALDTYQIPLKAKPNTCCKKCHGRFYTEFNLTHKHYIMCTKCAKKLIDISRLGRKK